MTVEANQTARFEPVHSAHAIVQVVFNVQFESPLDDDTLNDLFKAAQPFKNDAELPGEMQVPVFGPVALMINGAHVAPAPPQQQIGGKWLRRAAPDTTIESELRIERNGLTFIAGVYTRWETVWGEAFKYFSALLPLAAAKVRISAIGLNYLDKFSWSGNVADCQPTLLLRPGSKYVCPHVFEANDLWHSHTGVFIRADEHTKRLLNVNVDFLDEPSPNGIKRIVSILTILTDQFNQIGYEPLTLTADSCVQFLDVHMCKLHAFGKDILGNIVNDEMCTRIALIE